MSSIRKNLSSILDIDSETGDVVVQKSTDITVVEDSTDLDADSTYARDNIRDLISDSKVAIDHLLEIAKESETPRSFEVLANLIKTAAELNKDLLEIQKRKRDLAPREFNKSQNINVDKAVVFTGSTTELLKMINQNKNNE